MEENTQNKKAQMESSMFASLVLQGLSIIYVKPSKKLTYIQILTRLGLLGT